MNLRALLALAGLSLIAASAWFFIESVTGTGDPVPAAVEPRTLQSGPPSPQAPSTRSSDSGTVAEGAGKKPSMNWQRLGALMNGGDASALPAPSSGDVARFLAKHGETAENLVVAFQRTRDRRLLDRALALFPNSPLVLMAAIDGTPQKPAQVGQQYGADAERVDLIERWKAADPNNPLPWIYSAQERFKAGPSADAVAEVREALEHSGFYTYSTERMDAAQQLYETMGLHPTEASLFAMTGLTFVPAGEVNQTARMLMEWRKKAADSGDAAAADEALRLTYGLGRIFATPEASRYLIGQLVGISMEARVLAELPADARPEWLSSSPAQLRAEIDAIKQDVREAVGGLEPVIQSRNEEVLSEYSRRMRNEGEAAALAWLKRTGAGKGR